MRGVLSPGRLAVLVNFRGPPLSFGCDDNLNLSAPCFTSSPCSPIRIFTIRRSPCRGSAGRRQSTPFAAGADLKTERFCRRFAHSGTWLSRNSRCIQKNQFHYSCGPGHARHRHFLLDAGTCRAGAFFLTFLMPQAPIMISRRNPCSPLSHGC